MKAQSVIRLCITIFIVTVATLSALGLTWWNRPPDPLQGYIDGGKLILAMIILSSIAGLWVLWRPVGRSR
jgi:hypothetical protein